MKCRLFRNLLALATAGAIGAAVAAPPENDDQENAIVISGESGEVVGSNDEATFEDWEDDCASKGSIWYEWTVPATGYYLFETDGSTRKSDGEALDTYLVCWEYWEDRCDVFHNDYRLDGSEFAHEIVYAEAGETFLFGISTYGDVGTICLKWRPVPVSNFLDGTRLSFVWNVAGATKESFSSTDAFGNTKCLVDRRIIDGEKTSGWHDDTYWCTALSEMDILVWTGWAQDAGYTDVDSFADYFRGYPGLLRTKPDRFGDFPNSGTYAGSAFAWFEDEIGELPLASGVSFSHDNLLDICGYGLARFNVVCDCTSRNWAGIGGTVSHALVCCGFEIDAAVSEQDPARLSGIYVIDPDNDQETNGGAGSAPNSISYHPVTWNAGQGRYDVANVWDGRDGYIENQCAVLYVKPGYVPTVIDVSGGGNPQPDPPPGPVQPDPPPAELAFGPGLVSTFETDDGTATVAGVANLTWEMFCASDHFSTTCFVDSRIVDAEKDADRNNDDFWCGALTDLDMMFALGWLSGLQTVDEAVGRFQKDGESDIRWVDDPATFDPTNGASFDTLHEGRYGYADEDYYTGMFRWAQDAAGAAGILDHVSAGTVGADFLTTLRGAFPNKLFHLSVEFPETNSHPFWSGCDGGVAHSVLCCGFVSDGSSGADALRGLFIIDSDNDQYTSGGGATTTNSIAYCPVEWDDAASAYRIRGVWGERGTVGRQYVALERRSAGQVAAPVLDPPVNATFAASLTVKCTCPTERATIRFTTNDTEVTESSAVWADLTLTATTVVRVRAFRDGLTASDEAKCVYTLDGSAADPGRSSRWTEPVVEVGRGDELEATAATTYTGWLHDSSGNLKGSFTMKVGKASKKTGLAKVTLTVTDLETGAKRKYSSTYNAEDGEIEGDGLEDLSLGQDGVVGKIGKLTLTGGRTANKQEAQEVDGDFKGRVFAFAFENAKGKNVRGAATFTVSFAAKGKAKVSGMLMDGTKVSVTAQLIVGDSGCALPVSFTKKGKANFGLVLWFDKKKATFKEATGLTTCTLGDGQTDANVSFVDCAEVDKSIPKAKALSVDGKKVAELELAPNGKKWTVTAAKGFETAKPKLSFAAKKGTFAGSYKATVKGAAKPVTAKITGVWLGKSGGVGTAVMKVNKVVTAFPVLVK